MREPAKIATMLRELVDVLLPGDERFPAASEAGTHGVVTDRLVAQLGEAALDDLAQTVAACGGPLEPLSATERQAVVRRFETDHPEQFETLRMIAYLAYYENPAVVRAVRSLGHVYNDAPQPAGYAMAAFDENDPLQAPAHRRGHYVKTEDVTRLDLAPLPPNPLAPETITQDDAVASGRGGIAKGAGGKPAGGA
ncbi:MAG: hypothetical protein OXK73_08350 [Rhodospirillaceae bacterium]|nr:hypothetical protein [Rhodospirillaceae bacterium]